jgi:hypothetical protein
MNKKFLALKLKVPKISFGTATLKHYKEQPILIQK